jgi:hypothetical protein
LTLRSESPVSFVRFRAATNIGGTYCKPSTKAAASELCKTNRCVSPVAGGADTLAPDACATMHHVCIISQGIVGALSSLNRSRWAAT